MLSVTHRSSLVLVCMLSFGSNGSSQGATGGICQTFEAAELAYFPGTPPPDLEYGQAIAIHRDTVVVGAPSWGGVYVHHRSPSGWEPEDHFFPPGVGAVVREGEAVAIWGDTLLVGAPGDDEVFNNGGATFLYERTGSRWNLVRKWIAGDVSQSGQFGSAIDIGPHRAVVGATSGGSLSRSPGKAYVLRRTDIGWQEEAILEPAGDGIEDWFGASVHLDGDWIVVGAPLDPVFPAASVGSVYVFERVGPEWIRRARLTATGGLQDHQFGASVSKVDGRILVGAYRAAGGLGAVYEFEGGGSSWHEVGRIVGDQTASRFGWSLACDRDTLIVGAPWHGAGSSGAAFLYRYAQPGWVLQQELLASQSLDLEFLGAAVDLSPDTIVAGAPSHPPVTNSSGVAYAFERVRELGVPHCFGDGSGAACPCGNESAPCDREGCLNANGIGSALGATGSVSVAADDLELRAVGLARLEPALLVAGTRTVGAGGGLPFGDGLLCAGGSLLRLGVQLSSGSGELTWGPGFADGDWVPGDTRVFQVLYRSVQASACGSGTNASGALSLSFSP